MAHRILVLALFALTTLAAAGDAQEQKVKRDRRLITADELAELQGNNGYEAVQNLRPDWLRRSERRITLNTRVDRGSISSDDTSPPVKLTVFIEQTEMGGVEELMRLRNDEIEELRYFSGSEAQQKYGARFSAGVILVRLKT
ncbi:MAG: hypothetical protein ACREOF_11625 [Gemmatimonadales bacterium]